MQMETKYLHKRYICAIISKKNIYLGEIMERSKLSELILSLERGTNIHICVAFQNNYGNRMTRCPREQAIHEMPACLTAKNTQGGLAACYRCRSIVQKYVISKRRSLGGLCKKGLYEYCRPVVYGDDVIAVIYVGNVYLGTSDQIEKLSKYIPAELYDTMEHDFTPADCEGIADLVESYILFLFDKYGNEGMTYDPLTENIKNYICENMAYGFSISELAAAFNYNEKYLGRLFKSREGMTIRDYCNCLRVDKAKNLLRDTDLSISQIAAQVGFNNITYFDRVFSSVVSVSPRTYRIAVKKKRPDGN